MARQTLQLRLGKGDRIGGRYLVLKKLGEGGCGSVYHCKLDRSKASPEVAVKVLENPGEQPRFSRELKVLRGVSHSRRNDRPTHIVKYLDHGNHERHPYLVMEFMPGGSLRDVLDEKGRLGIEDACWVAVQTLRGLRQSNTFHRDLKPENLLLGPAADGGRPRILAADGRPGAKRKGSLVKVADFGLAKSREGGMTQLTNTGQIMGTPIYMSPEQCRNTRDVTILSDIYSLGIMLYEMVAGKPPFDGDSAYDIMSKHCNEAPAYPRGMDEDLKAVIARCLAKKPEERWKSFQSLEKVLCAIAGIDEPAPEPMGMGWWLWPLGVATFATVAWLLRDPLLDTLGAWWKHLVG